VDGPEIVAAPVRLVLTDTAYLRALHEDDVTEAYIVGLNDPRVHRYLTAVRRQRQTYGSVKAYVCANRESNTDILFGLFVDDVLRGTVRLHDINASGDTIAWLGVAIFDLTCHGQGWGWKSIATVARFGCRSRGLRRICAGIYAANTSSRRAFEKAGFRYEGPLLGDEAGPAELWIFEG
jgi:RimJ/RimL family protein N-acetyltransferase